MEILPKTIKLYIITYASRSTYYFMSAVLYLNIYIYIIFINQEFNNTC